MEKPLPELVVTKGGIPFEDQAEGIRQFKEACLKGSPQTQVASEPNPGLSLAMAAAYVEAALRLINVAREHTDKLVEDYDSAINMQNEMLHKYAEALEKISKEKIFTANESSLPTKAAQIADEAINPTRDT